MDFNDKIVLHNSKDSEAPRGPPVFANFFVLKDEKYAPIVVGEKVIGVPFYYMEMKNIQNILPALVESATGVYITPSGEGGKLPLLTIGTNARKFAENVKLDDAQTPATTTHLGAIQHIFAGSFLKGLEIARVGNSLWVTLDVSGYKEDIDLVRFLVLVSSTTRYYIGKSIIVSTDSASRTIKLIFDAETPCPPEPEPLRFLSATPLKRKSNSSDVIRRVLTKTD